MSPDVAPPADVPAIAPTKRAYPKRRRRVSYLRSSLYQKRPWALPDPSTEVGRLLAERRAGLVADLGGEPSTAQAALIDLVIRDWAILGK